MHFKRLITSKPEMPSRLSADITHIYEVKSSFPDFLLLYEGEMFFCTILNTFVSLKENILSCY